MASLTALQETSQALSSQVVACEERANRSENELRVEREWRFDLQDKEQKGRDQVNVLQIQIKQLNDELRNFDRVRNELERVKKQWSEAQTTLEELGIQLSVSKLKVSELEEQVKTNNALLGSRTQLNDNGNNGFSTGGTGIWSPDNSTSKCKGCEREFSITRRKVGIRTFIRNI